MNNINLIPYLTFENTKEALAYYQDVFGITDIQRESPNENRQKTCR